MFLNRVVGEKITQKLMQKIYKHAYILFIESVSFRVSFIKEIKEDS